MTVDIKPIADQVSFNTHADVRRRVKKLVKKVAGEWHQTQSDVAAYLSDDTFKSAHELEKFRIRVLKPSELKHFSSDSVRTMVNHVVEVKP